MYQAVEALEKFIRLQRPYAIFVTSLKVNHASFVFHFLPFLEPLISVFVHQNVRGDFIWALEDQRLPGCERLPMS